MYKTQTLANVSIKTNVNKKLFNRQLLCRRCCDYIFIYELLVDSLSAGF